MIKPLLQKLQNKLLTKWIACRLISDKQSVQYGSYFSYPVYLALVVTGVLLKNPYLLAVAAVIAFLGIKLPLHPFDYIYNQVANLIGTKTIPGRGSELQVNSIIAVVFNLTVIALIVSGVVINYTVLAVIYVLASIFFIVRLLLNN